MTLDGNQPMADPAESVWGIFNNVVQTADSALSPLFSIKTTSRKFVEFGDGRKFFLSTYPHDMIILMVV